MQPLLHKKLLDKGFKNNEIKIIPNGFDWDFIQRTGTVTKEYDVVWVGRVHRQKGIEDLLHTLAFLAKSFPDFKALLIGDLEPALAEPLAKSGLSSCVHFTGYIYDVEKYRRLKSARLFLMTSHHEGLPLVIGEALACGLPVVAYDLEMYRGFYGQLISCVEPFKIEQFCQTAAEMLKRARTDELLLPRKQLVDFQNRNSWESIERQFIDLLEKEDCRKQSKN